MRRFLTIGVCEFRLFVRDFFGFFFTFVFPLLMLVLYGSIYGNEPVFPGNPYGAMDLSVPAYAVMIVGVTGLMAFPLTLAEYKDKHIYKRFDATPAGKRSVILAQVAVNVVMTLLGFVLLLTAGTVLYHIRIDGPVPAIAAALLLSIAAIFSLGFFFTAVARDAKITNLLCYLAYFVMIFLSGATIPRDIFPQGVKTVSRFLPMTYAVDLMQGAFRGEAFSRQLPAVLVLGTLTVLCTAAGAWLYRRQDWS